MSLSLPTPDGFPAFPYDPPYPIQVQLMRHLYRAIEASKVAIVESPTGTGKTLSLLCASLTWLMDNKNRVKKSKYAALGSENDTSWVVAQSLERRKRELEADEQDYEQRLANARKKEAIMKKMAQARVTKKQKHTRDGHERESDDDWFLPQDEDSGLDDNLSPAVRALMHKVDKGLGPHVSTHEAVEPTCTKIYYASRTHSQLAQILQELRRLKLFPLSFTTMPPTRVSSSNTRKRDIEETGDDDEPRTYSRTVALGSRKQLCINQDLRARSRDLDEGCRELLGEKKERRCPYLPSVDEGFRMTDFRDQILASPKDIEDLALSGHISSTCPYFGSRLAIPQAELVTLPYNLLLSKTARDALGIDLTNQIVIIDEAHNLISALLSLSTARLSFHILSTSLDQLSTYLSKFRTRLTPAHALHLKRLVTVLNALKKYAVEWKEQMMKEGRKNAAERMAVLTVPELVQRLGRRVEGVNLLEIQSYLRSSRVAKKISGYTDMKALKAAGKDSATLSGLRRGATPPLHAVEAFMLELTAAKEDGRVILSISGSDGAEEIEIKYQLLNPSTHFREIVDAARSTVLAGGTLSPVSDIISQLFSHLPSEGLSIFSCGHIIPPDNLKALVISKGPRGGDLTFKHSQQENGALVAELGQIILNFVSVVPSGMVVFFPSYSYFNVVKAAWERSGMMKKFGVKKKVRQVVEDGVVKLTVPMEVFLEPQDSSSVDVVLKEYSAAVCGSHPPAHGGKQTGALLFAVIGAKLSEGLNFADDLARAVIVVGLPFANLGSPELQERFKYVNRLAAGLEKRFGERDAASELYENMCMNAVNQSIGRAIRHQTDWASLILIDQRYTSPGICKKLPKWIGEGTLISSTFGHAMKELGTFYRGRR